MREATDRARARRRADADRGQDLPHRRPPRGRPGGRHLPHAGGDRRLGQARPGRHVPPAPRRGLRRRRPPRSLRRSRRGSRRWSRTRSRSPGTSPEPDPATVRRHVFADPINPPEALPPAGGRRDRGPKAGSRRSATASPRRCGPTPPFSTSAKAPASAAAASRIPRTSGRSSARERMVDTPISEQGFTSAAVGASATGARTVSDLMFADFAFETAGQIFLQAAKLRYMSNGAMSAPMVVRVGGRGAAELRAAPQRQLSSDLRAHAGARSSAFPRRRPTPRG